MLISLALRNVLRNLRRLAPMMFILIIIFTLLIAGNAILGTTIDALYSVYAGTITGDLTVSPAAEDNFTVFGSDQLLVGRYLIPPTLTGYSTLISTLSSWTEVSGCAGLITSAARVELGGQKKNSIVFGVNFDDYTEVVSDLRLTAGSFPEPGQPGMVIQNQGWDNAEGLIGSTALLASGLGRTFTLREVPVTGVFSYPVTDAMLENVVLVDAATARALNGYLHGSSGGTPLSEQEKGVLESNVDTLFDMPEDVTEDSGSPVEIDPLALFTERASTSEQMEQPGTTDDGAWNFLLISLHERDDASEITRRLAFEGYTRAKGYLVRDWSSSVGGNARLAMFLQVLFNIGLLFVSFGAVIVATNALLLSVLERTGEIGTLRAMGASRWRISLMIFLETLFVVFGSALVGILAGKLVTDALNNANLVIENPYMNLLFGGKPLRGTLRFSTAVGHLAVALLFTILSMLYPLKRALSIQPVEAMAE